MLMMAFLAFVSLTARAPGQPGAAAAHATRWPKGAAIHVWISPVDVPADGEALVERALKTWTDAAEGRFRLEKTASKGAAAVRIYFVKGGGYYGETLPRVDGTGSIVEADVAIAGEITGTVDPLTRRIIVYLTALHELGHVLGLKHSDHFDAIMYLFRRPDDGPRYFTAYRNRLRSPEDIGIGATGLFTEDIQALRDLYDR